MAKAGLERTMGDNARSTQVERGQSRENNLIGYLMVTDTETVPDPRLTDLYGEDGPPLSKPGLHQVVALPALVAEIRQDAHGYEFYDVRSSGCIGLAEESESEILSKLMGFIDKKVPRIATWGGNRFDVVNWEQRLMAHAMTADRLYNAGDRFNHYRYRFNDTYHVDLMDRLSGYGASQFMSQDEVARMIGFPGKGDIDGSQVHDLYREGRIHDIRAYGELDTFDLYGIFVRHALLTGRTNKAGHDYSLESFHNHLLSKKDQNDAEHVATYLARWGQSQAPVPYKVSAPDARAEKEPATQNRGSTDPANSQNTERPGPGSPSASQTENAGNDKAHGPQKAGASGGPSDQASPVTSPSNGASETSEPEKGHEAPAGATTETTISADAAVAASDRRASKDASTSHPSRGPKDTAQPSHADTQVQEQTTQQDPFAADPTKPSPEGSDKTTNSTQPSKEDAATSKASQPEGDAQTADMGLFAM